MSGNNNNKKQGIKDWSIESLEKALERFQRYCSTAIDEDDKKAFEESIVFLNKEIQRKN